MSPRWYDRLIPFAFFLAPALIVYWLLAVFGIVPEPHIDLPVLYF